MMCMGIVSMSGRATGDLAGMLVANLQSVAAMGMPSCALLARDAFVINCLLRTMEYLYEDFWG
ncbi:hypothetical protein HMPREF2975_00495 [Actinomyces sp. HMSC065F12]|nr:hypothetical protein HMPREF2975_00495 [Actinomyces sp. HMSC065F12]